MLTSVWLWLRLRLVPHVSSLDSIICTPGIWPHYQWQLLVSINTTIGAMSLLSKDLFSYHILLWVQWIIGQNKHCEEFLEAAQVKDLKMKFNKPLWTLSWALSWAHSWVPLRVPLGVPLGVPLEVPFKVPLGVSLKMLLEVPLKVPLEAVICRRSVTTDGPDLYFTTP